MDKTENRTHFLEHCIKCNKLMRAADGKTIGGMMRSTSLNGETIYHTTCWQCAFSDDSSLGE